MNALPSAAALPQSSKPDPNKISFITSIQDAIEDRGLDAVTLDDIVRYSGIARTTLYRRHGGRDAIIEEFLRQRLSADIEECRKLAISPAPFVERIEQLIIFAIMAAHRHAWLQRELQRGLSDASLDLLAAAMKNASDQTLAPLLRQAKADGICRCQAPFEELHRWLLIQIFELSRRHFATCDEASRIVRAFVMPVLALDATDPSTDQKIDFIYRQLLEMQKAQADTAPPGTGALIGRDAS